METGDINNDAVLDLIIGAPEIDCPPPSDDQNCGKTFLFYGPIVDIESTNVGSASTTEDVSFYGENRTLSSSALLSGHDLNNDSIDDFVVSAPKSVDDDGAIYVVFGQGM